MVRKMLSVLVVAMLLAGCSSTELKNHEKKENDGTLLQQKTYLMAGKIEAENKADIASKISAKVVDIKVDVGSAVKKGEPLIQLDSKDLEAQVAQAQAGVDTAQANLSKILRGARPEQIAQVQAAFESAGTNYANAKNSYERNRQLFNDGGISEVQLEQYQTAFASAEASYKSSKEALDLLNKGETSETIKIYQSQLKQAQAALELARTQLHNATIVSPLSGVVAARNINAGELAAAGIPLVTVVNSEDFIVNAYLPAALLNKVQMGQEAVIKVADLHDQEFNGEISVINSVVDSKSKNFLVKVKFKEQDPALKSGMFAEIGLKD